MARDPCGVPVNLRLPNLFLKCSRSSANGEELDVGSHVTGDVGSKMRNSVVDVDKEDNTGPSDSVHDLTLPVLHD